MRRPEGGCRCPLASSQAANLSCNQASNCPFKIAFYKLCKISCCRRSTAGVKSPLLTMKTILTLVTIVLLSAISAHAKTFKLPNDEFTIASIDIPDSWKPKEVDRGVECQSPDDAVYMSIVAVGSEKGMNAELEETFAMLKERNVVLDDSSKKENKFKVGSLDATELLFQGKDDDGPTAVSIVFIPIKDKVIVATYWVETAKEQEHQKEVGTIVNSLKASS